MHTIVNSPTNQQAGGRLGGGFKRLFDLFVAAVGLLLLSPLFAYIALRIRGDSPGPVFYRGRRAGRGGRVFHILKFRTMYERPESYQGPDITAQDDPRVTPTGRWLRDNKLNELPQLWNVLKGEMSLVGPRPEVPDIAASWPEAVRREVLTLRPGITSPASVLYHDEENLLSGSRMMDTYLGDILPSKLRLDQLYARHHSFWGDLDILFWTAIVLVPRARTQPAEQGLFLGPMNRLMDRHVKWFIADLLVTLAAMAITGLFWRSLGPLNLGWPAAISMAFSFALLFSLTNAVLRVNRIDWSRAASSDAFDLLPGAGLATVIALFFNYYYPAQLMAFFYGGSVPAWLTRPLLPNAMILMASFLAFLGFVVVRYRSRLVTGLATRWVAWRGPASAAQERVLIIGGGETGQFAAWMLNRGNHSGNFRVVGFVDDDLYKQGSRILGVNVLGQREDILDLVSRHDVGILVFAIHNIAPEDRAQVLRLCGATPARLVVFPDIPAALTSLMRQNGNGSTLQGSPGKTPAWDQDHLPCNYCLMRAAPVKVDAWLAQLEETAASGDVEGLLTHIRELRQKVHDSTPFPLPPDAHDS
jgi:lipopolysaccharide/colanic/teichoic acid biosynthesis glycosyltransferase